MRWRERREEQWIGGWIQLILWWIRALYIQDPRADPDAEDRLATCAAIEDLLVLAQSAQHVLPGTARMVAMALGTKSSSSRVEGTSVEDRRWAD